MMKLFAIHSNLTVVTCYDSTVSQDTLGTEESSLVVRCPDFRGCNVHKKGGEM